MDLPTLTISAGNGWMRQEDRFSGNIAGKEQKNYTLLHRGELSYNHGNSKLAKYGTVFSLQIYEEALVPRVYHSFKVERGSADFVEYYFATKLPDKELGKLISSGARMDGLLNIGYEEFMGIPFLFPKVEEQSKIALYFRGLDSLITLHQRIILYGREKVAFVWEQRKLGDVLERRIEQRQQSEEYPRLAFASGQGVIPLSERKTNNREQLTKDEYTKKYLVTELNDIVYNPANVKYGAIDRNKCGRGLISPIYVTFTTNEIPGFIERIVTSHDFQQRALRFEEGTVTKRQSVNPEDLVTLDILVAPKREEQQKIATYFDNIDHLITLHHRKPCVFVKTEIFVWEQRKFSELVTIERGGSPRPIDKFITNDENGLNWIKIGDAPEHGNYITQTAEKIRPEGLSKTREVHPGDLILSNSMSFGRPYIMAIDGCIHDGWLAIRDTEKNFDLKFLCILLGTDGMLNQYKAMAAGSTVNNLNKELVGGTTVAFPMMEEQIKIGEYFSNLDHLITLHHRKPCVLAEIQVFVWEQRKLGDVLNDMYNGQTPSRNKSEYWNGNIKWLSSGELNRGTVYDSIETITEEGQKAANLRIVPKGTFVMAITGLEAAGTRGNCALLGFDTTLNQSCMALFPKQELLTSEFLFQWYRKVGEEYGLNYTQGTKQQSYNAELIKILPISLPSVAEQMKIFSYLSNLDHLITLHQHKQNCCVKVLIYVKICIFTSKKEIIMAELEAIIEQKLIEQLIYGESQWTYRSDLKTEEDLWNNFRYILEQNNKDRLNGEQLSDVEFDQVKNQLQFSSFYKAGEWLVGENGKVMVHVQRDTEKLHLVVMNHEHIAGGSSVYEVINQYRALADDDMPAKTQDRRFDVTLMINGLPMIHIELKNKQHSYMDGFWQIKKYISEGKFTGIFSAVQMLVISNGVDTKYFSAASDTDLNPKFVSGWLDRENNPVTDYLEFAKSVLRIPEAHEMIARYTVLDEAAKKLILLRPYQIHAIESIRDASKIGKSGFVWHTTGSGKTLTSYKATRNLLMDIPSIDKAIFLIDRKDLDAQTTMAFQAYANNDLIDVDETDNVSDLKKKLKSDDRQVIVTTIQKLQRLITKRLQEGTSDYNKIKNLRIAFVVDECHRAVTPATKRELERFFGNSLWYGFTGTPRFAENPYPQMGDLPRTTEELYGKRLHKYTIQNAIHDNAVLGFQVEHNGPKNMPDETDSSVYESETHMLGVLDVILNKSFHKLGFQNGKGKTYEGLLTTSSIQMAQKYYALLKKVKNGETTLQIDEKIRQVLPDFPKFAITYSVTENEEGSHVNQQKMQESLDDYNEMFGTKYDLSQIQGYNGNLNKRLARKDPKYKSRNEQLDLVIVVDRLLTGFDAPCMSTIFIDRQPMGPHDLIQAFSRTNRILDKNKAYGQIVTFQAPKLFKECVDNAVKLYSAGSTESALLAEWDEIEPAFRKSLNALRASAATPAEIPGMSKKEKQVFAKMFQNFDKLFAQLKSFSKYDESMLEGYGITETEYEDYAGHYLNVRAELEPDPDDPEDPDTPVIDPDYELMAYSHTKIDYEYIINLIQNIVTPTDDEEVSPEQRQKQIEEVKQYIEDLSKENPKVAEIMTNLVHEIEQDEDKYKGQSILNIVENMKYDCIEKVVTDFCLEWYASKDDVMYAATHYRNGEIPNRNAIKSTADFASYKEAQKIAIPKFKYYNQLLSELAKTLDEEIKPLLNN